MKVLVLLASLAPALAAPFWGQQQSKVDVAVAIPEMTVKEWNGIQSTFVNGFKSLSEWSWKSAEEIANVLPSFDDLVAEQNEKEEEDKTIWGVLQDDPHSFSKLVKILKFEKDAITYLDDNSLEITLFAPNDDALTPPKRRGHGHGHHGHHDDLTEIEALSEGSSLVDVSAWLEAQPSWVIQGDGDEDHKRRLEIIRKIVGKVLQYHGLSGTFSASELAKNSTFSTVLKAEDGSYGGQFRRVKVEKTWIPPSIKVNGYAKVYKADIKASNGLIHALDHPLLPPPSIIDAAFLFPDLFSTATSSVQKIHGTKYLDWEYDRKHSSPGHPKFKGIPLTTFFLPSNLAFGLLPPRLKFFLFSPFGERALEAVLRYHAIPETLLLSEFHYYEKYHKDHSEGFEIKPLVKLDADGGFHKEFDIRTALNGTKVHIEIEKRTLKFGDGVTKITFKVDGVNVDQGGLDVPARNGAFHVINKVLVPPHKHHDHKGEDISHLDDWENWEDWLPAWAESL